MCVKFGKIVWISEVFKPGLGLRFRGLFVFFFGSGFALSGLLNRSSNSCFSTFICRQSVRFNLGARFLLSSPVPPLSDCFLHWLHFFHVLLK